MNLHGISKLSASNARFLSVFFLAWLLAGLPPAARACGIIADGNGRENARLNEETAALAALQVSIKNTETACTTSQNMIATQGARSATSESCVTFRENAALNQKLTEASRECAQKVTALRKQIDSLKTTYIAPQEADLAATVQLDSSLNTLAKICGKQMAVTKDLRGRSRALLENATAAIGKATEAISNYSRLADQTQQFANAGSRALRACDSSGSVAGGTIASGRGSAEISGNEFQEIQSGVSKERTPGEKVAVGQIKDLNAPAAEMLSGPESNVAAGRASDTHSGMPSERGLPGHSGQLLSPQAEAGYASGRVEEQNRAGHPAGSADNSSSSDQLRGLLKEAATEQDAQNLAGNSTQTALRDPEGAPVSSRVPTSTFASNTEVSLFERVHRQLRPRRF